MSLHCLDCGKQLVKRTAKRCKSCSVKGRKRESLFGDRNPNWKGGAKSSQAERVKFHETIRDQVLKRDDYTCQLCGVRGGQLQVDHIQSWAEYVEGRFCIDNCRTICVGCHYELTFGRPMPANITWGGHVNTMRNN